MDSGVRMHEGDRTAFIYLPGGLGTLVRRRAAAAAALLAAPGGALAAPSRHHAPITVSLLHCAG